VAFTGVLASRNHYKTLLASVRLRVLVPIHWDDLFRPLTKPLRPMLAPPRLAWPPLRRLDLPRFACMIAAISPKTRVIIPEIFRLYDVAEWA
jgi:hypothetical protein